VAVMRDGELASHELEEEFGELEEEALHEDEFGELEEEAEDEQFLGAIGNIVGSLLGEGEEELEYEDEMELGELEDESSAMHEDELGMHELGMHELGMHEFELESGEAFFGGLKKLLKRAAPILGRVAKIAAPMVARAVGGPLGGMLSQAVGLGEGELEHEHEHEFEFEGELEHEHEAILEAEVHESGAHAELMASVAAGAATEAEAEAMIGAATVATLTPRQRRQLRRVLAHLVRGSAILTRMLRQRRITRPAVRTVPFIVNSTARTLTRAAAQGQPINRRTAGRVMAAHTRRVIARPSTCARVIQRNVRVARRIPATTVATARRPVSRSAGARPVSSYGARRPVRRY
jgi:hypothetical protein